MRSLAALMCSIALSIPARAANCTQSPPIKPGARIRFDAPSLGGRVVGTLVAWESDTLEVSVDGDAQGLAVLVPADSVTRLQVRREHRMTLEVGALGALAGTLVALAASPDVLDENGQCTTLECMSYHVSPRLGTRIEVLGAVGIVLGAIAGSGTKTASWAPVPLRRFNVGATPEGGLALGVRISF